MGSYKFIIKFKSTFFASFLTMTSVITFYFYIRISYQALSLESPSLLWIPNFNKNSNLSLLILTPTMSLPMVTLLLI